MDVRAEKDAHATAGLGVPEVSCRACFVLVAASRQARRIELQIWRYQCH